MVVYEQETTVSTQLTDRVWKILDTDWSKKTQDVSYTGKGYFVVDLDKLTKDDIAEDRKKKVVTIKIAHSYLEAIEIDPDKIMIDEVKESLFAKGDIKLTVADYNAIEKDLKVRMEEKFNSAENAQKADDTALKMVKEVYEPVIKAIDSRYDAFPVLSESSLSSTLLFLRLCQFACENSYLDISLSAFTQQCTT